MEVQCTYHNRVKDLSLGLRRSIIVSRDDGCIKAAARCGPRPRLKDIVWANRIHGPKGPFLGMATKEEVLGYLSVCILLFINYLVLVDSTCR